MKSVVAPVMFATFSKPLSHIIAPGGYECRRRNNATVGKMSAHALGLALDVDGFGLPDGRKISVVPGGDVNANAAIMAVRVAACGWFTTILGPGSDPEHATHIHVDVQQHGTSNRYRICD